MVIVPHMFWIILCRVQPSSSDNLWKHRGVSAVGGYLPGNPCLIVSFRSVNNHSCAVSLSVSCDLFTGLFRSYLHDCTVVRNGWLVEIIFFRLREIPVLNTHM